MLQCDRWFWKKSWLLYQGQLNDGQRITSNTWGLCMASEALSRSIKLWWKGREYVMACSVCPYVFHFCGVTAIVYNIWCICTTYCILYTIAIIPQKWKTWELHNGSNTVAKYYTISRCWCHQQWRVLGGTIKNAQSSPQRSQGCLGVPFTMGIHWGQQNEVGCLEFFLKNKANIKSSYWPQSERVYT